MWSSKLYGEPHGAWESTASSAAADKAGSPFERPNERVLLIEDAVRSAVHKRCSGRKDIQPRTYLESLLKKADTAVVDAQRKAEEARKRSGSKAPVRIPRVPLSGKISVKSFMNLLGRVLRVHLTEEEVKIVFKAYGHDNRGNMPYELFCRRLFAGKAKVLSMQGPRRAERGLQSG
eukprot:SAG31_NODE_9490_length_1268_cov_1.894782_2_plen_176_part_00